MYSFFWLLEIVLIVICLVLKAEPSNKIGELGSVLSDNLDIGCKEGSIKILEIQREGKRPQKINEFILGSKIKKGSNLKNA